MSTDLVHITDPSSDYMAGLGVSEGDAFKPSQLIMVQKPEQGTPGTFKDIVAGFEFERIQAVPIAFYNGRVLYVPDSDFGTPPLCRSSDGKQPSDKEDIVRQDGGLGCAKCPKSQWAKVAGKLIRPECNDTMQFIFVDQATEFVYRLNLIGTSIVPTRNLRETLRRFAQMHKIPPIGVTVELSSVRIQGKKGASYYTISYGPPKPIKDQDAFDRYRAVFDALVLKKNVKAAEDPVDEILDGEYVAA